MYVLGDVQIEVNFLYRYPLVPVQFEEYLFPLELPWPGRGLGIFQE